MIAKYVVYVQGRGAPSVYHETREDARAEALRLARAEALKVVAVARVIEAFRAETKVVQIGFENEGEKENSHG